jgi:hypothetical protein
MTFGNIKTTRQNREGKKLSVKASFRPGSALAMTMFILSGMLIVAFSGAYVVTVGLRSSGTQGNSLKAYFAAESGAEKVLWELRQHSWTLPTIGTTAYFPQEMPAGASFESYYTHFNPIIFKSVGSFNNTKRSVELRM